MNSKLIKAALAVGALSISSSALACSPLPLELNTGFHNRAASHLLTKASARLDNVDKVIFSDPQVIEYKWIKSDSGFECHDYEVLSVNVEAEFEDRRGRTCTVSGKVVMTDETYEGAGKTKFEIVNMEKDCK